MEYEGYSVKVWIDDLLNKTCFGHFDLANPCKLCIERTSNHTTATPFGIQLFYDITGLILFGLLFTTTLRLQQLCEGGF